jgi:two-component system cell cycle response regulator
MSTAVCSPLLQSSARTRYAPPPSSRATSSAIEELQRAVSRIESGELATRVDVRSGDELGRLGSAFNAMSEQLAATTCCAAISSTTSRTSCARH